MTKDTKYSESSLGYEDPTQEYMGHCSDPYSPAYVKLGPSDIYICRHYRCEAYTCPEGEIPNENYLACIPKAVCGEHEDYLAESNTCACKPDYVKIGDQCVESVESTCDKTKEVYDKSSNTCACHIEAHWTGDVGSCTCAEGYVEIGWQCVESVESTCDTIKEAFDEEYNMCVCNADGHWTGDVGECRCTEGYVEINGKCVESVESTCDTIKEVYQEYSNTCVCNFNDHWTGTAGACVCKDGFVPVGKVCMEKVSCTGANETYDATANACICNASYFRVNGKCVASSTLVVGDLVEFGRYPQYENSDIPSPLMWQVLDIKDGAALMLSQYVLEQYQYHPEQYQYHPEYTSITWERSNVRSYLNGLGVVEYNDIIIIHDGGGFIDKAFTAEERQWIKEVTNKNPNAPEDWGSTPGGNDTKDKVFLLSYDEVLQYLPTDKSRVAHPTAYAIHPPDGSGRNNLWTCQVTCSDDNSCSTSGHNNSGINVQVCSNVQCSSAWWLRSPGACPSCAPFVDFGGGVNNKSVDFDWLGLRPALYVHMNI